MVEHLIKGSPEESTNDLASKKRIFVIRGPGSLLVNIECLVSYPIKRNASEKKEVRARLPLYRISQSR